MKNARSWFISAGEHSGDLLARDLVKAVSENDPDIRFFGVGGDEMQSVGVDIKVHLARLSVMGLFEVLSKLPEIVEIEQEILDTIERQNPEVCILVDFPGFHFRLAKRLKARGIKVVQYVAPKVWAWGQERVKRLQSDFDLVLGVLPFEKQFFTSQGVNFEYVGSPHIERVMAAGESVNGLTLDSNKKCVAILPGSRKSEIKRVAPELLAIFDEIHSIEKNNLEYLLPVSPNLDHKFVMREFHVGDSLIPKEFIKPFKYRNLIFVPGSSLEVMNIASAAILTSGTATLECGLLKTPMIVLYKMNNLSYHIAKFKLKVNWISLVNLSANKTIVNEYIQHIPYAKVANEIISLAEESETRMKQLLALEDMAKEYHGEAEKNAATWIFNLVKGQK